MLSGDYDDFYRHYEPFVAAYIARRTTRDEVDDIVSGVFATAWRRRDSVPEDALPWLYRTARNIIGNQYRSTARWVNLQTKLRSVPSESPVDPAEVAGERSRLIAALGNLTDDDRELLLLVAWEGLTAAEIAVTMDISPGTASVRLHRARQRLERTMQESTPDPNPSRER